MLLSELVGKNVYSGKRLCGVCRGIGLSLRSRAVKYLFCSDDSYKRSYSDFFVSIKNVLSVSDGIRLKRLRAAAPSSAVRFFTGKPIYSEDGVYLGIVSNLVIENFYASKLITDAGQSYSAAAIAALNDAVILKKQPNFPLGGCLLEEVAMGDNVLSQGLPVGKATLRSAIENGKLIRLTTSLAPFCSNSSDI